MLRMVTEVDGVLVLSDVFIPHPINVTIHTNYISLHHIPFYRSNPSTNFESSNKSKLNNNIMENLLSILFYILENIMEYFK
jgi:hypothetical protein